MKGVYGNSVLLKSVCVPLLREGVMWAIAVIWGWFEGEPIPIDLIF